MLAFRKSQPVTATGQEEFAYMGKDVVFKGIMTLEGNVRIDGQLEGEIRTTGTVTIGEHAVIKGNIMAGTLITSGRIKGDIIASEKIKILKPGILIGDIRTPAISIEEGSHFHGLSDMGADTRVESHRAPSEKIHALAVPRGRLRAPDY